MACGRQSRSFVNIQVWPAFNVQATHLWLSVFVHTDSCLLTSSRGVQTCNLEGCRMKVLGRGKYKQLTASAIVRLCFGMRVMEECWAGRCMFGV